MYFRGERSRGAVERLTEQAARTFNGPMGEDVRKVIRIGLLTVGGAVALGILVFVIGVFDIFFVRPRRVFARYDAFVAAHPIGSKIDEAIGDPFVEDAAIVMVDGKAFRWFGDPAEKDASLAAWVTDRGVVDVMWVHTPPFGRVGVVLTYDGGRITALRKTELD